MQRIWINKTYRKSVCDLHFGFHIPVLIIDPSLYFIYLRLTQLYFVVKYTELCAFKFRPYGLSLSGSL